MIIGRDSIIQHSLLMYDPDFNTFGMRIRQRDDSSQDLAYNSAVGKVEPIEKGDPTVRGETNESVNQEAAAKQPDGTFVEYLHEVH